MDGERLRSLAATRPETFATALGETVRSFTRRNPAPRALPFFGFDHPEGCGSKLLDRLSDLGIFRFYERVLDLGSGLGGPARWLARRRGCRVVSVSADATVVRAAERLGRRAHLEAQVAFATARLGTLPFPEATFTHVWSVEQLHREADKASAFREAFRTVRPGGQVGVQDWVWCGSAAPSLPAPFEPLEAYREGLRRAGFTDLKHAFTDDLREGGNAVGEILAERLAGALADLAGTADVEAERGRQREVTDARRLGHLRLVQLFAGRPS